MKISFNLMAATAVAASGFSPATSYTVGRAPTVGDAAGPRKVSDNPSMLLELTQSRIAASEAKSDSKIADLKGEMKAATQAITGLKDRLDDLSNRLGRAPSDIATITERISHLPTKEYLVKCILGSLAVIAGLVTFGDKLQALVN